MLSRDVITNVLYIYIYGLTDINNLRYKSISTRKLRVKLVTRVLIAKRTNWLITN